MIAFDPFMNGVRGFDLHAGEVFRVHLRPFLVACSDDSGHGSLLIVDEYGRVRSVDECEVEWRTRGVVPEMVCHIGAWRGESCSLGSASLRDVLVAWRQESAP